MNPDSVNKFWYVYVLRSTKNGMWYVEDARSREKQLKSGFGRSYLGQRIKRFLTLSG